MIASIVKDMATLEDETSQGGGSAKGNESEEEKICARVSLAHVRGGTVLFSSSLPLFLSLPLSLSLSLSLSLTLSDSL